MQIPPPAAPSKPPVPSAPVTSQIPSAQAAATSPAVPAHTAQTAPTVASCATPTKFEPAHEVTSDTAVSHVAPTPAPIDSEAESKLTAKIIELWAVQKDGKAVVKRTRAELKALKLELSANLYLMKSMLVGTGRGGGWASYLRAQSLPLTTADRLVAQHEATLAPPEEKLSTDELSTPTVDEIRRLAHKILPKVSRRLTTQELVYEFVHELVWHIDVAVARHTDKGFEIPKSDYGDAPEVDAPVAELANPAPTVP